MESEDLKKKFKETVDELTNYLQNAAKLHVEYELLRCKLFGEIDNKFAKERIDYEGYGKALDTLSDEVNAITGELRTAMDQLGWTSSSLDC